MCRHCAVFHLKYGAARWFPLWCGARRQGRVASDGKEDRQARKDLGCVPVHSRLLRFDKWLNVADRGAGLRKPVGVKESSAEHRKVLPAAGHRLATPGRHGEPTPLVLRPGVGFESTSDGEAQSAAADRQRSHCEGACRSKTEPGVRQASKPSRRSAAVSRERPGSACGVARRCGARHCSPLSLMGKSLTLKTPTLPGCFTARSASSFPRRARQETCRAVSRRCERSE